MSENVYLDLGEVIRMRFDWSDNFVSSTALSLSEPVEKTQYEICYTDS